MIRPATPADAISLIALAEATGIFQADDLAAFGGIVTDYFAGNLGSDHCWICDDDAGLVGAAYFAPEMMAEGTWNLYFIGVHPIRQGQGRGGALLRYVEETLTTRGERLLLVETSGLESFAQTRAFYLKNGYDKEARIRDFYSAGNDMIVFRKVLPIPQKARI